MTWLLGRRSTVLIAQAITTLSVFLLRKDFMHKSITSRPDGTWKCNMSQPVYIKLITMWEECSIRMFPWILEFKLVFVTLNVADIVCWSIIVSDVVLEHSDKIAPPWHTVSIFILDRNRAVTFATILEQPLPLSRYCEMCQERKVNQCAPMRWKIMIFFSEIN